MKQYKVTINGNKYDIGIVETTLGDVKSVDNSAQTAVAQPKPVAEKTAPVNAGNGMKVMAPMPGTVLKIKAKSGASIKKGDPIIVLEAMKMENEIAATADGIVTVCVAEGTKINSGDVIATIA